MLRADFLILIPVVVQTMRTVQTRFAECLTLSLDEPEAFHWLPTTCAYKLVAEGDDLPSWHPLVSGRPESVHETGISVLGRVVSEKDTDEWSVLQKRS